jgi:hypothetical protein
MLKLSGFETRGRDTAVSAVPWSCRLREFLKRRGSVSHYAAGTGGTPVSRKNIETPANSGIFVYKASENRSV